MSINNYLVLRDENTIKDVIFNVLSNLNTSSTDVVKFMYRFNYGYIYVKRRSSGEELVFRFMYVETSKGIYNIYEIDTDRFVRGDKSRLADLLHSDCGFSYQELSEFFNQDSSTIKNLIYRRRGTSKKWK